VLENERQCWDVIVLRTSFFGRGLLRWFTTIEFKPVGTEIEYSRKNKTRGLQNSDTWVRVNGLRCFVFSKLNSEDGGGCENHPDCIGN
jgi:hypothetical protein